MKLSRRGFLRAGGLAMVSYGLDPLFLTRAVYAQPGPAPSRSKSARVLVCLFQRGAVDGLSMLVPHGDARYYEGRPNVAIPEAAVVDLDGRFGLHPALAPLKPLWDAGVLAPIHAIGSPDPTRSHFDAQDYMESGTPGVKSTADGWLNRYCQHQREHDETPFRAVSFGPELPRILAGSAPSLAIGDLRTFGVRAPNDATRDRLTRAFERLYETAPTGLLASSAQEGFEAANMLRKLEPERYVPEHDARYPNGRFGQSLLQIAQLIKADVGLEIAFADVSGWDTHVNQGAEQGPLANRLGDFAQALAAFAQDLGDRMNEIVVVTCSEFGRTIAENGSGGTDHGRATAMMVLGGPVRGRRVLGRWPGLEPAARFEGRDLAVTTDFRDLFAELLARHLGAGPLDAVFPGFAISPGRFPGAIRG
jgi:uncharacterized protein (DUF1501 family)